MNDLHKFWKVQTKQKARVKSLDAYKDAWSASRYCNAKQLQCFILAWRQALAISKCLSPQKKVILIFRWQVGKPRRFSSFFFTLTDLVKICRLLVLCPSHFTWLITLVISSSAITKSEIIFKFAHLLMQLLSANDQHGLFVWGASANICSTLSINEHFFKSNDAGGFSVGLRSKIMVILQYKALLFSHFAAFPQQYSSPVWDREAKRGIKRKWQVLSLH